MKKPKIEFVSYDYDEWGALCEGTLTLNIDGKTVTFGDEHGEDYPGFWATGGRAGIKLTGKFSNDGIPDHVEGIVQGPWQLDDSYLPEHLKPYAQQLLDVFNENVPWGCCGYCI